MLPTSVSVASRIWMFSNAVMSRALPLNGIGGGDIDEGISHTECDADKEIDRRLIPKDMVDQGLRTDSARWHRLSTTPIDADKQRTLSTNGDSV